MISATLVIYNEEERIRTCLESIKHVVDEIIIVHDGPCTDKTLDICKTYGARIFIRPYIGEAEPHRLFSFEQAQGEWILQIDADEALSKELQYKLHTLTQDPTIDAYSFRWEDEENLRILGLFPLKKYKPCLFRKTKIKFEGLVHEPTGTVGKLVTSDLLLHHKPKTRISNPTVFTKKTQHWSNIAAQTLIKKKKTPHPAQLYLIKALIWGAFYLFYYLFIKGYLLCGKSGLGMARYHATYNFLLNYNIYKLKKQQ